jgi:uncharacterized protein (DUF952 family)
LHTQLYKVLKKREWEEACQSGKICTSLDYADGFIHLSSAIQLNLTLSLFFSKEEKVVLLEINESDIAEGLTYERAGKRGGEFAHFYGELSTKKISQLWHLDRSAFSLPSEVLHQAEQN